MCLCAQEYDIDEVLGRCVGPLTCVVSQVHSAAAAASSVDVTHDTVQFSLVEVTLT